MQKTTNKPLSPVTSFSSFYNLSIEMDSEKVTEHYKDGSLYVGEKENGLRHGYGKFSYADGGIYEGSWKYGAMEGEGKLYYPDGNIAYEGQWKNNAFNGKGKVFNEEPMELIEEFDYKNFDYLQDSWERYEGDFVNDFKEG
jgi:hypothetical protein